MRTTHYICNIHFLLFCIAKDSQNSMIEGLGSVCETFFYKIDDYVAIALRKFLTLNRLRSCSDPMTALSLKMIHELLLYGFWPQAVKNRF